MGLISVTVTAAIQGFDGSGVDVNKSPIQCNRRRHRAEPQITGCGESGRPIKVSAPLAGPLPAGGRGGKDLLRPNLDQC